MTGWATPTHMALSSWRCSEVAPECSGRCCRAEMLLFSALCPSAELSEPGAKWQPIGSYECRGQVEPKTASGDHPRGVDATPDHRVCLFSKLIDNEWKNFSEYTWQFRLPPFGGVLWTNNSLRGPTVPSLPSTWCIWTLTFESLVSV